MLDDLFSSAGRDMPEEQNNDDGCNEDSIVIIGDTVVVTLSDVISETETGYALQTVQFEMKIEAFRLLSDLTQSCGFPADIDTIHAMIECNGQRMEEGEEAFPFDYFVEHPFLLKEFVQYQLDEESGDEDRDGFL